MRSLSMFTILLVACGGTGGAPGSAPGEGTNQKNSGDNHAGGGSSSGGFSLAVQSAAWETNLKGEQPGNGRIFVALEVSIANESASPILASAPLFSVLTQSSIVVPTSGATALTDSPCTDLSVAQGGTLVCSLAFEIPTSDTPVELDYDDHMGHAAQAAVQAPTRDACSKIADWTRVQTADCSNCLESATGCASLSGCTDVELSCIQTGLAPDKACSLPATCSLSQSCAAAWNSRLACEVNACDASCS